MAKKACTYQLYAHLLAIYFIQGLILKIRATARHNKKCYFQTKRDRFPYYRYFKYKNSLFIIFQDMPLRKTDPHFAQISVCHATLLLKCSCVQVFLHNCNMKIGQSRFILFDVLNKPFQLRFKFQSPIMWSDLYLYFVFKIYLPSVTIYKGNSFQRRLI